MCFKCRLSALISGYLHPNQVNGVGITTHFICVVIPAQLFHGQVCVIPSLFYLQGAHKRSRVHFKCGIWVWNLLLSTLNMKSKELSPSVKQASLDTRPNLSPPTTFEVGKFGLVSRHYSIEEKLSADRHCRTNQIVKAGFIRWWTDDQQ